MMLNAILSSQTDSEAGKIVVESTIGLLKIVDYQANKSKLIPVAPRTELYIGRSPKCVYVCSDPTVSQKHVRIRSLVFDDNEIGTIPPLVYADDLSTNGVFVQKSLVPRDEQSVSLHRVSGSVLLSHGDKLQLSSNLSLQYIVPPGQPACYGGLDTLQELELESLKDRYIVTPQAIGMGGHGSVFAAVHRTTGRQLACKVIDLRYQEDDDDLESGASNPPDDCSSGGQQQRWTSKVNKLVREFQVVQDLDHPNIVRLEKAFWTPNTIYIFQELLPGGDLFSYVEAKDGPLEEAEASVFVLQILKALDFLHGRDIVHRDLKPDNILLSSTSPSARIVLSDFGHARQLQNTNIQASERPAKRQRMTSIVGTFEYCAPEIHRRNPEVLPENGYSKAIDIWSLGCISFVLLSGEQAFVNHGDPLFKNDPLEVIMKLASQCDLSMIDNSRAWNHVSKRAKGFVKDVLVLDESRRLDAKQALRHPWFTNPRCAREFHEVYQHCIRDWKPRGKVFKLVERLAVSDRLSSNQNRSRYFTSAPRLDPSPHSEGLNRSSPTLPSIAEEPLTEQAVASMGLPRMSFGPSSLVSQFSMPKEDLMETMSQLTISQFNMMGTQHSARLSDHSRRTEDLADVKGSMDISIPNHGGDFDVDFHDMVAPYSMSLDMKECVQETPPRFPANCSFPNSQTA